MADREIVVAPKEVDQFPFPTARFLRQVAQEINKIRSGTTFGTDDSTDYMEIEDDGTIRFYGDATAWVDINIDLIQSALGASAPDVGTVGGGTINYLLFDGGATTEEVSGAVELQHNVKLDVIKPHVHWFPTTTDAGNVKWFLTYSITNVGDAPSETTLSVVTAAPGAITSVVSGFGDIDVSSFSAGAQFAFRFYRNPGDAADTYAHDVATKTLGLHVELQSMGTRTTISE